MPAVDLAAHIIPARIKSDLSAPPRVTQCEFHVPTFNLFFLSSSFVSLFATRTSRRAVSHNKS